MKKIKVVMITTYFDRNGVASQVLNYSANLDENRFQLSIIAGAPYDKGYEGVCCANGIKLYKLPQKQKDPMAYYKAIYAYLKQVKPDIAHVHGSSALITVELLLAKLAGVPITIAHSHNTTCSHIKSHKVLKLVLNNVANGYLACGNLAGKWMYGDKKFTVIPNAFKIDKFILNTNARSEIRKELGVESNLVIGNIGKFNDQKNQGYLIQAFERIAQKNKEAVLLLVGIGPDQEMIKQMAESTDCKDHIIFYGEAQHPEKLYSAMDIFALPSKFEGLPIVLLEAQISGLPCVVSDKVTREVDLGDINWQPIDGDPQLWADAILSMPLRSAEERLAYREEHINQIENYDITQTVKQLDEIYTELMET